MTTTTTHALSTTIQNSAQIYSATPKVKLAEAVKSLEHKIPKFYPYFILCTGLYNLSFGVHQLMQGFKLKNAAETSKEDIVKIAARFFKPSENFQKFHGVFSLATGSCSLVDSFHRLGLIDICQASSLICTTGSFCFFYANVTALVENLRQYEEIEDLSHNSHKSEESIKLMKKSVIAGILSNFGYIFATAFAFFEAPFAITLVVGIISSFCGGMKVLYDLKPYIEPMLQKQLNVMANNS